MCLGYLPFSDWFQFCVSVVITSIQWTAQIRSSSRVVTISVSKLKREKKKGAQLSKKITCSMESRGFLSPSLTQSSLSSDCGRPVLEFHPFRCFGNQLSNHNLIGNSSLGSTPVFFSFEFSNGKRESVLSDFSGKKKRDETKALENYKRATTNLRSTYLVLSLLLYLSPW